MIGSTETFHTTRKTVISNLRYKDITSNIPNKILTADTFDAIQLHKEIFASATYIFLKARVQPPSNINFEKLDDICRDYWDWQLPLFLRYGFPLDFPDLARKSLVSTDVSHASASQYPSDIEHYIETERKYGAFFKPPFWHR